MHGVRQANEEGTPAGVEILMPYIDLILCSVCGGSCRAATAGDGSEGIAGAIKPCSCGSGVEAITDEGEVMNTANSTPPAG